MIGRRSLLHGALALAGAVCLPACGRRPDEAAGRACAALPAGVQLFTLREPLGRDARAALRTLAELGIAEVELFGLGRGSDGLFGVPLAELKALLDALGLSAPLAHVNDEFDDDAGVAAIAERARALGVHTVVIGLPREFMSGGRFQAAESAGQLDQIAERLGRAGRAFRERGLRFAYHNHHVEFVAPPVAPALEPFDYLLARVDPADMAVELDVGWVAAAGRDPVRYLDAHRGRVVACHLKDFRNAGQVGDEAPMPQTGLVEPGAGDVDFAAVLESMRAGGVRHGFIEIDETPDPQGAVARGHRYLQSLRC